MYRYDEFDAAFVKERTAQFSDQVARRLTGELNEDQFRPLRLMNGLYLQLHAYMLRIAVPYGTMNSNQMRMLAHIARTYDRGYGHFTTRQNIQFNWPKLRDIPKILGELAAVEMHAIQPSGTCIRNITPDQFAGAAADIDGKTQLALLVPLQMQADVVGLDGGAVALRSGHRDLELARQVAELGVQRRPLAQDLGDRTRIDDLVGRGAGELVGGDVADAVARGLDGMHLD